jgi:hypothetical protein
MPLPLRYRREGFADSFKDSTESSVDELHHPRSVTGVSNILGSFGLLGLDSHTKRSTTGIGSLLSTVDILEVDDGAAPVSHDYRARKVTGVDALLGDIDILHGHIADSYEARHARAATARQFIDLHGIDPSSSAEALPRHVTGIGAVLGDLDILSDHSSEWARGDIGTYDSVDASQRLRSLGFQGRSVTGIGNVLGSISLLQTRYSEMQNHASTLRACIISPLLTSRFSSYEIQSLSLLSHPATRVAVKNLKNSL